MFGVENYGVQSYWFHLLSLTDEFFVRSKGGRMDIVLECAITFGLRFKFCNFICTHTRSMKCTQTCFMDDVKKWKSTESIFAILSAIRCLSHLVARLGNRCITHPHNFHHPFNLHADTYSDGFRQFYDAALHSCCEVERALSMDTHKRMCGAEWTCMP